jgi:murein L,D-transpeptidase YafK
VPVELSGGGPGARPSDQQSILAATACLEALPLRFFNLPHGAPHLDLVRPAGAFASPDEVKRVLGGLLALRTLSVGLSLAAALLVVALACMPSYSGPHPGDAFLARAQQAGLSPGDPVMIRMFKRESQLELWMRKDDRFELFATYPICFWSGRLGPKEREGDRQAPEGFYAFALEQLRIGGRHPRSINIGFPNAFDRALGRTGSYILLHGGCTSSGCFAMTDPVMEEIYTLADQALRHGQDRVQVQIFPFRLTEANLAPYASNKWYGFWRTLKQGYDAFESTRVPPAISVCNSAYVVSAADWDGDGPPPARVASDACSFEPPVVTASAGPTPKRPRLAARPRVASSRKMGKASHGARVASRPTRSARSFRKTAAASSKRIH